MNNLSILIVEDEPALLERLTKYIAIFCDEIYTATNGLEALEVYKEHKPDIILTDVNMPKLTGIELVKKIRQEDEHVQLIILSAHTNTKDLLDIVPLDVVQYLVKPISMECLKEVIMSAIDKVDKNSYIHLNHNYEWDDKTKSLYLNSEIVKLSSYESAFLDRLIRSINADVSYEDIHLYINEDSNYSQDAIFTLVKRIRKKTTKDLIKSSFKFGYKIESL